MQFGGRLTNKNEKKCKSEGMRRGDARMVRGNGEQDPLVIGPDNV